MNIRLNEAQLNQLSDIAGNLSVLFFGTVLTPVFTGVDRGNPIMLALGLVIGIAFLLQSLLFLEKVNYES